MFRKRRVVLTCWAPSKQSYFARLGLKHQFWLCRGVRQLNSPVKGFTPKDSSCHSFRWEWIQLGWPSAFIIFPSSLVFAFLIVHLTFIWISFLTICHDTGQEEFKLWTGLAKRLSVLLVSSSAYLSLIFEQTEFQPEISQTSKSLRHGKAALWIHWW